MSAQKYEMILCIVNAGFAEVVMDAARAAGAGGGTLLHARGTASKEAEKRFNIAINPDKEALMLVVPLKIKDDVLHAIYKVAGTGTNAQGIAFSLPVNDIVGIKEYAKKPAEPPKES